MSSSLMAAKDFVWDFIVMQLLPLVESILVVYYLYHILNDTNNSVTKWMSSISSRLRGR